MVHSRVRGCVPSGFGLRISPGRVAIRNCRSDLVRGCGTSLVAGGEVLILSSRVLSKPAHLSRAIVKISSYSSGKRCASSVEPPKRADS